MGYVSSLENKSRSSQVLQNICDAASKTTAEQHTARRKPRLSISLSLDSSLIWQRLMWTKKIKLSIKKLQWHGDIMGTFCLHINLKTSGNIQPLFGWGGSVFHLGGKVNVPSWIQDTGEKQLWPKMCRPKLGNPTFFNNRNCNETCVFDSVNYQNLHGNWPSGKWTLSKLIDLTQPWGTMMKMDALQRA